MKALERRLSSLENGPDISFAVRRWLGWDVAASPTTDDADAGLARNDDFSELSLEFRKWIEV